MGILLFLLGWLFTFDVWAHYMISPLKVHVTRDAKSVSVILKNIGTETSTLQTLIKRWDQEEGGKDRVQDTDDWIVTPQIFQLAPNQKQIIRIKPRKTQSQALEQAYRLFLKDVPDSRFSGKRKGLHFLFSISIPVFMEPLKPDHLLPVCKIQNGVHLKMTCKNPSNRHHKIKELLIEGEKGSGLSVNRYLLPHRALSWHTKLARSLSHKQKVQAVILTNDQKRFTHVPLEF